MDQAVLEALRGIVGADDVRSGPEDLHAYGYDATPRLKALPGCVVFARTTEQVAAVLRLASERGVAVVTRGSGTNLSGGTVPASGCIVLCTTRFDRILEIDEANLTMLVEPGVITDRIAAEATSRGLFYPPDPGSIRISTIGGNVAENSGGLRGLKYGVTRDYIMGLEVVLATGETLFLGNKCVKDVAGYSLRDLFVGSEGTLGVITKILLKLLPAPEAKRTMLATFASMEQAAAAVSAIIAARVLPCTLEFLDRTTINCIEEHARIGLDLPADVEALLLIETDGHPAAASAEADRIETICRDRGVRDLRVAGSEEEAQQLTTARRTAYSALARVRPTTVLEDVTVPRSELAGMVRFIQETARKYGLRIGVFGHFGDGNLHPTCLCDERDSAEMERVERALDEIFGHAVALGGTITGEHGVGLAKKAHLESAVGRLNVQVMRHLKQALDPQGILNPGKILD